MSIADKLNNIVETKGLIKQAIIDKGVQVSDSDNFRSYADKINSIKGGPDEYIPLSVDSNGVLVKAGTEWSTNATDLSEGVLRKAFSGSPSLISVDLSSLNKISAEYGLAEAFEKCANLTTANLSNLTEIAESGVQGTFIGCSNLATVNLNNLSSISKNGLSSAFGGCTSLTSINLDSLTTCNENSLQTAFEASGLKSLFIPNITIVYTYMLYGLCRRCKSLTSATLGITESDSDGFGGMQYAFNDCTSLIELNLSSLTHIHSGTSYFAGYMCQGCTSLTSVNLSSLQSIEGYNTFYSCFEGCTALSSFSFPALTTITGSSNLYNCFSGCTNLKSLSFPALTLEGLGTTTGQFNDMLDGVSDCTVHFPASLQSTLSTWTSVANGFSGINTTVVFDL